MCGIIGYTGTEPAGPILLNALHRLEYRGYDSAGIAVQAADGGLVVQKTSGKLNALRTKLGNGTPLGIAGIGHTRWATHGGPTDFNAHPHSDCHGNVTIVHNGIVENYAELKQQLQAKGHVFTSQTDSECISHLVEDLLAEEYSLEDAVAHTASLLEGANAVVTISSRDPGKVVAFRLGHAGGIVVGYGDDGMFVASDLPALISHTRNVAYLSGGEAVAITGDSATFSDLRGGPILKSPTVVPYDAGSALKGEYEHFMLKEINEQAETLVSTMRGRVSFEKQTVEIEDFPFTQQQIESLERVVLVGMGTSLHAAMVGRHWIESIARLPAEFDNASEFRYRDPIIDERTLVVSVGQSGETADTLGAMEAAALKNAPQITICNHEGSQAVRVADGMLHMRAGLEISVAGSKTFTCSLAALYLLSLYLAKRRGTIDDDRMAEAVREFAHLPDMVGHILERQQDMKALAEKYASYDNFLYLGRGLNFPLAMEGALKLKEISYVHAEGYQAGEMKHGPISLVDENMPVVALMPRDDLRGKMLNNISEVKARKGKVIAIATEGDSEAAQIADDVIYLPETSPTLNPILAAIPLQLLAYHIAVCQGRQVDQPRNLAKTVTVE